MNNSGPLRFHALTSGWTLIKPTIMARLSLAAIVVGLAYSTAAHAVQSVTTPNAVMISYNLAANTDSVDYQPALSVATHLMGTCLTPGNVGVNELALTVTPTQTSGGTVNGLYWSVYGPPFSATIPGTHIMPLDNSATVFVESGSFGKIRISNESGIQQSGYVTMLW